MPTPLLVVADWNGTVVDYEDEAPLWKKLGLALADDAKRHLRLFRLFDLLKAKKKLEELHKSDDFVDKMGKMYEIYNRYVLKGVPVAFFNRIIDEFAEEYHTHIDTRIVRPIDESKTDGACTAILSAAYDGSILRILRRAGYEKAFEYIEANPVTCDDSGRVDRFVLQKYRNKAEFLHVLQKKTGSNPERTVYIGDNELDDECFSSVKYPAVSFCAKPEYKETAAKKGRFVPEKEEDLRKWLRPLL